MATLPIHDVFPVLKKHAHFDTTTSSLEELMLKGEAEDSWIGLCEKVGQFLATTRKNFNTEEAPKLLSNSSIRKQSILGEWIQKINNSWDDSVKKIVPERRTTNNEILETLKVAAKKTAELMENANVVNFGNLVTKNVQLRSSDSDVQVNFAATELVQGPSGLDTAVFLADILVTYYQQLRLEHGLRYVTSDCAKSLGRAFDNEMNWNEDDRKQYWKQTSLLTGWEIIRRLAEDQAFLERSQQREVDLASVFDAGYRLINNRNLDNINFMIVVALAEIF